MIGQNFLNEAMKIEAFKNEEVYNAYVNYLEKQHIKGLKTKVIYVDRDAQRSKVYMAETEFRNLFHKNYPHLVVKFENISQAQEMANQIIQSDWWNENRSTKTFTGGYDNVEVKAMGPNKNFLGTANLRKIELSESGMNNLILIHEICHSVGNMHHGVNFRKAHIDLIQVLYGNGPAKLLKQCYKNHGLKIRMNEIKTMNPSEWLKSYQRAQVARNAR